MKEFSVNWVLVLTYKTLDSSRLASPLTCLSKPYASSSLLSCQSELLFKSFSSSNHQQIQQIYRSCLIVMEQPTPEFRQSAPASSTSPLAISNSPSLETKNSSPSFFLSAFTWPRLHLDEYPRYWPWFQLIVFSQSFVAFFCLFLLKLVECLWISIH